MKVATLPRKIFENLHAIMAVLMLIEYFQANCD